MSGDLRKQRDDLLAACKMLLGAVDGGPLCSKCLRPWAAAGRHWCAPTQEKAGILHTDDCPIRGARSLVAAVEASQ